MIRKLLIANRGEIAIRIARSAAELGIATVAVFSEDDAAALHTRKTDDARPLPRAGPAAYLDAAQIIAAARETGCDAIHPGYGFLSENAEFARGCAEAGLVFVGPTPETLAAFGDKARAREIARACDVPVLPGTGAVDLAQARAFLHKHGAVMLKAVAGGGGRGMRLVRSAAELDPAFARCASEAKSAFGNDAVYAEAFMPQARHIEVQIVGDGAAISHLWDRDCSIQRQRQKLIEIAPALTIPDDVRQQLLDAAVKIACAVQYKSLGTIEFLVDVDNERFAFIEANPRLQVEHTVTEEVLGLDLVRVQLEIAGGASLADLHLTQAEVPSLRGVALQARVNMETMQPDGSVRPAGGTIEIYEPPSGRGIRVDGFGYAGYRTSARFDSLLAKLIVHAPAPRLADVVSKAYRALSEFRIVGVPTNIPFLQNVLRHHAFESGAFHTRTLEDNLETLLPDTERHKALFVTAERAPARAGVRVDSGDPLAVLHHGKADSQHHVAHSSGLKAPDGMTPLLAPLQGTIVNFIASVGDTLGPGEPVLVMEAMKMEHVIEANAGGVLREFAVAPGDTVFEDTPLAFIEAADVAAGAARETEDIDLDRIRPDLEELYKRRETTLDRARPEAVEKRRKTGQRTVRENIQDLCDPGSFVEYASLVVAGRLRRSTMEELIARTPGDGLVMGLGRVNGDKFSDAQARIVAMSYDYTVLAGTQGLRNHQKKDRLLQIAEKWRIPIVFFTEGGGGRPGDTDAMSAGGLNVTTFHQFAKLSGLVPLVGINSGYCFAGNAALLGCCDVIIATKNSSIGMGGPAMIEGGGLGVFHPKEVGPVSVQAPNGVIDIVV
ncbi:MAG TPA: biotin carboxylase N-terminal domain-containing protein, partial [Rhizomicrobium sp.]